MLSLGIMSPAHRSVRSKPIALNSLAFPAERVPMGGLS